MKISIITVCYNSIVTLETTIKSVINQSYSDIEYIVVDGGSTDGTLDLIDKYKKFIDKTISGPDSGIYDAMNKGILMASGDLIGILNSDDFFYDNKVISRIVEYHLKNSIDISVGNIVQHNDNKIIRIYSSKKWLPEKLKIGFMPPHPSMFVKKSIYDEYGLYKLNYLVAADYELMIRFFIKHNLSWGHNGITTTKMLIGGVSSSGLKSYRQITKDILQGFSENNIKVFKLFIKLRVIYKLIEFIKIKKLNAK
jgi:glycosyltransferase involved in cell wall biosynthesis